jgi:hypothetical protein
LPTLQTPAQPARNALCGAMRRLAHDTAGNTMLVVAAASLPLLAMIGGSIDMGRGYLTESRLQQACDAGVLAARKKLGAFIPSSGSVPADVATTGDKFFNINFRSTIYGSQNRQFTMTLEPDYSISGVATVEVPTTIMKLFGFSKLPVQTKCQAKLNFTDTDVMMVLDTTGSMADKAVASDPLNKMDSLRQAIKSFHAQLESSKGAGTRIRYGFMPYSTNVNVGYALKSGWMVDKWAYQGRVAEDTGTTRKQAQYDSTTTPLNTNYASFPAYQSSTCPKSDDSWVNTSSTVDADGYTIDTYNVNGTYNYCTRPGADSVKYTVGGTTYNNYQYTVRWKRLADTDVKVFNWRYKPVTIDVSSLKGPTPDDLYKGGSIAVPMNDPSSSPSTLTAWFRGCIEERDTYIINDYANVDFTKALDLDIDQVPILGVPSTQWRPVLSEIAFVRNLDSWAFGSISKAESTSEWAYFQPNNFGMSACPAPAKKLAVLSATDVAAYVDALAPEGSTYHDIGMIWGGRFLSPKGIFASENADAPGKTTARHLIFLTDGLTAPLDLSYGTYGIEPLEDRRWNGGSSPKLVDVVEDRFKFACQEVRKRNITIWVIGFGISMPALMEKCAGADHAFQADDAAQLNDAFSKIAKSMGDLRISK